MCNDKKNTKKKKATLDDLYSNTQVEQQRSEEPTTMRKPGS
jgi:hypothetical protein